ncbi:MAG: TIGR01777 family oxidoreductase [Deltaproteobacteria bacterium]|nr:TIGR01777 family oxidoreductase [Deltaproteobacteria bacterium]
MKSGRASEKRRVFVSGGTGLIGAAVTRSLVARGDRVVLVSRRPVEARGRIERACGADARDRIEVLPGDPAEHGDWQRALDGCDVVLSLAGEPVWAHRWSEAHKRAIRDSRVRSTERVVEAIAKAKSRPSVLVSSSAVGFYGPRGDEEVTEETGPGRDFLARVCVEWEDAAREAESSGVRVARVRTGIVLSPDGGALERMVAPFRAFVGGPIGSGKQWFPWIHLADEIRLLLFAMDDARVTGAINAVAPRPVTMTDFARALGRAMHRPSWLAVPGFSLAILFGEGAEVLLTGQRVVPAVARSLGFEFEHPSVDAALADLLDRRPHAA